MSALQDSIGGMLNELVEAQRGMTDWEVDWFLATGQLPDLSQPPVEEPVYVTDIGEVDEEQARAFLAGFPLVAAGGSSSPSERHYVVHKSDAAFKFNPGQERWPSGAPSGLGGQWKDDVVPETSAPQPVGKKVVPAIIYKKHADGAVVAQRDNRRLRWDGGTKKFAAEEHEGGSWVEKQQLTKTAAYAELKEGDWREPSSVDAAQSKIGAPGEITRVTSVADVDAVAAEVTGTDDRSEYVRRALGGLAEFGTENVATYISRDKNGKLTGAMTVVDHVGQEDADDLTSYSLIDYIGALGDGAGTELVRRAVQHAVDRGTLPYAEPTEQSAGFWQRMGFREDPKDEGVAFFGLTYDEAVDWLKTGPPKTSKAPITPPQTPEAPPAVVEPTVKAGPSSSPKLVVMPNPTLPPEGPMKKASKLKKGEIFTYKDQVLQVEYGGSSLIWAKNVDTGEQQIVHDDALVGEPRTYDLNSLDLAQTIGEIHVLGRRAHPHEQVYSDLMNKSGMGKILKSQDQLALDRAQKMLAKLTNEGELLANRALNLMESGGHAPWGSVDTDAERTRWSSAGKPTGVVNPGVDKVKLEKVRDTYVVNDFKTITNNRSLRSGDPSDAAKSWRTRMDRMTRSSTIAQDSTVYRGAAMSPEVIATLRPGSTLLDPGLMSTDEDKGSAEFYAGIRMDRQPGAVKTIFTVRVLGGTPGVDVGYGEFVFPSGTGLRVVDVQRQGNRVDVVVEMISPVTVKKGKK